MLRPLMPPMLLGHVGNRVRGTKIKPRAKIAHVPPSCRAFGVVSSSEPPRDFAGLERVTPIVYLTSDEEGTSNISDISVPSVWQKLSEEEGWTTSVLSCRTASSLNSSLSSLYGTLPPILVLSSSKSLKVTLKYLLSHPLAGLVVIDEEESDLRSTLSLVGRGGGLGEEGAQEREKETERWQYLVEGVAVVPITVVVKVGCRGGGDGENPQLEYLKEQLAQGRTSYAPTFLTQESCKTGVGRSGECVEDKLVYKRVARKTMLDDVLEYHKEVGICACECVEVEEIDDIKMKEVLDNFYNLVC